MKNQNLTIAKRNIGDIVASTFDNCYKGSMALMGTSPIIGMGEELYKQFQSGNYDRAMELGTIGLVLTGITSFFAYGIYKLSAPKYW